MSDYSKWIDELRDLLDAFDLTEEQLDAYSDPANWVEYFNEDFTPEEALAADIEFWKEETIH